MSKGHGLRGLRGLISELEAFVIHWFCGTIHKYDVFRSKLITKYFVKQIFNIFCDFRMG